MRFSWLALAILLVAACQPVPRPFEHDRSEANELLRLTDTRGIVVLPVADAPPDTAHRLADEMVASLIDLGIPAYVIDLPGGKGKVPILPDYLQSRGDQVLLRSPCGELVSYPNCIE